jgi:hypothetical protein
MRSLIFSLYDLYQFVTRPILYPALVDLRSFITLFSFIDYIANQETVASGLL